VIRKRLEEEGVGKLQLIWNAGLDYRFKLRRTNFTVSVQAYNILGYNRYRYKGGENQLHPSKLAFYKEPTAFILKLKVAF